MIKKILEWTQSGKRKRGIPSSKSTHVQKVRNKIILKQRDREDPKLWRLEPTKFFSWGFLLRFATVLPINSFTRIRFQRIKGF